MSITTNRTLYYFLRACLALLGLLLVGVFLFSLRYADIIHTESPRPSWQIYLFNLALLLYGSLLLIPFRWLKRPPVFPFAMLVFALGVLWAAYAGISSLVGLAQGRKSWLILPAATIFVVLAIIAPAALVVRRRFNIAK